MNTTPLLTIFFITTASTLADFVPMKFVISPSVRGLSEDAPLSFLKNSKTFDVSIPISDGEKVSRPFTSPQDLVLKSTWLLINGMFSEYRLHIGKPPGLPDDLLTVITSDATLAKIQASLKVFSLFEPILLIEESPEELYYLIYRLKGDKDSAIYISSVIRNTDGSYSTHGGELNAPEYKALFNGLVQEAITKVKCVSFEPK